MRNLFTSERYVKSEFRYYKQITSNKKTTLDLETIDKANWTGYFNEHYDKISKGYQFTRLAVQEPYGVMILKASQIADSF